MAGSVYAGARASTSLNFYFKISFSTITLGSLYLVIIPTPPRWMGAPFLIATSLPKALLLREAGSSPSPQPSQTGQWRFQSVRQVREQRKRKRKQGN